LGTGFILFIFILDKISPVGGAYQEKPRDTLRGFIFSIFLDFIFFSAKGQVLPHFIIKANIVPKFIFFSIGVIINTTNEALQVYFADWRVPNRENNIITYSKFGHIEPRWISYNEIIT